MLLPEQWEQIYLGELAALKTGPFGSTLHKSDYRTGGIPIVNPMHIVGGKIVPSSASTIAPEMAERLSEFRLQRGDVVLGRRGEMGRCAVVGEAEHGWLCGTGSLIVRPGTALDPHYLQRFLSSPAVVSRLGKASVGSTMVNLNQRILLELEVPTPPLIEQKRIADKLDAVLAQVDACRERLDRVQALLKHFRQAVLAAAISGKLTEEWREERNKDGSTWEDTSVGTLIRGIEAGINFQCEERPPAPDERGLVKISAVTWGVYDDNESKTLPPTREVPEATRIVVGDFLLSRANTLELVGACVLVDKVTRPVYLSDKVLRLVMSEEYKKWLLFWLRSQNGRKQIEQLASGNQLSMRNLSQANLKTIAVRLPPSDERAEIVRRVETLFTYADRLEARYTSAHTQVERLTPALLAKAFRGELVPQDPNDEPASVLLERIRAARAAAGEKPPRKVRLRGSP